MSLVTLMVAVACNALVALIFCRDWPRARTRVAYSARGYGSTTMCDVRLGAGGYRAAGVGFSGVERSAAQGQGMVHAQAADIFTGRGSGADAALVGSRWASRRASFWR